MTYRVVTLRGIAQTKSELEGNSRGGLLCLDKAENEELLDYIAHRKATIPAMEVLNQEY